MTLTPAMAALLAVGLVCITVLTWHHDITPDILKMIVSAIAGAFAPGTFRQISQSMRPPPYKGDL